MRSKPILSAIALSAILGSRAATPDFTGTYELEPSASDNIENAIKAATSSMSFIVKPIARSRLKKVNKPHPNLFVQQTPDTVTIAYDPKYPMSAPLDGNTVKWKNEDGERFDLSIQHTEETLTQRFVAPDGERQNELRISADGDSVYMRVTITSPRLKRPLQYQLVYQRKRAAP